MNNTAKFIISLSLCCFCFFANGANSTDDTTSSNGSKSTTKEIKKNLDQDDSYWELDLGLQLGFNRNYLQGVNRNKNGDIGLSLLLSGGYYYKDLFVEVHPLVGRPLTFGYSLQRTKHFVVNIIAESLFSGFDESSQNYGNTLTGIKQRKTSLDAGIEVYYSYKYGEARFRALNDISNTHQGTVVAFDYAYPIFMKRWIFWPSYGITWLSGQSTDYYFGIDENEVRNDRPFYQPSSGITQRLSLYSSYQYNTYLSFFAHGSYAIVSNNINDSPLVDPNDDAINLGLGVLWSF